MRDEAGRVYRIAGIAEDITSRKQAEEEIRKALEKEKELSLLKSRFVSMTSHEFRTPFATILFSPDGGTVLCELTCDNNEVIFRILDQGIGIPKEDLPRLFETFHRAKNVGNIAGTGLGLAITKKFVELHGGEITVDSQVGVGTTFTVKLPLQSSY